MIIWLFIKYKKLQIEMVKKASTVALALFI